MKTKNKIVAIVEIAVVLCSLFLVAIPAIATDQNQAMQKVSASTITTASEDDYVLGVYGNANEDDTIDMGDVVYTKLAIFGKKSKTELCDAKYDGRINVLDVIQTKLIILGKEKEITVVDSADRIVTVKKPIKRLIVCFPHAFEALRSLKVQKDIIVGVAKTYPPYDPPFFPEIGDIPSVGNRWNPDIEAILSLHPDAVIQFGTGHVDLDPWSDVLESAGITVLRFNCQTPEIHRGEVEKLGYIFGKQAEAKEYLDWREGILNSIKEEVEKIPEEDKPKVYFGTTQKSGQYGSHRACGNFIKAGGGKNIFEGMSGTIDAEAVIDRDPDIIVNLARTGGYGVDADDTAEFKALREEIMSRPELQKVKAVEEGEVYILANQLVNFYGASGCRDFIGYAYFAKWLQPTLFEDLNPKTIHQEYLTRFQGLDIDLDEKGVFVYPEPS